MKIYFNQKEIEIPNVKKCSEFGKITGLMFSRRKKARALLFSFNKQTQIAIHSFFVFFPFLAIWMDNENKILEIKKVKPFRPKISSAKPYFKLLEIPVNKNYKNVPDEIFSVADGNTKDLNR